MHFFRDCCCGLMVPTVGRSLLVRQPGQYPKHSQSSWGRPSSCTTRTLRFSAIAPCIALPSGRRTVGAPNRSYFALALRACRWLLSPLRSGSSLRSAYSWCSYCHGWHVCCFRLVAPTVSAGAKNSHEKTTIFRHPL
jgi:hypothetical protein